MKIVILGSDGYLGYATYHYLKKKGHKVIGIDNIIKRYYEDLMDVTPLNERNIFIDIRQDIDKIGPLLKEFQPDAIIHYAEQPSAPFSMASKTHAIMTQQNNVLGTLSLLWDIKQYCPHTHLIKLGTMGEYGTPNIPIEEGWLELSYRGHKDRVLFPKQPGSFYHLSKVHDSHNIEFTCRVWGLRSTDLNQGIVYGWQPRFHYDAVFGTVINRFLAQAIANEPITVYGEGLHKRAFLHIDDTLQCVELALLNPPPAGEYRVFNQFTEVFSIGKLASMIAEAAGNKKVKFIQNPRIEKIKHLYNVHNTHLTSLGLEPKRLTKQLIKKMLDNVYKFKSDIKKEYFKPRIVWK